MNEREEILEELKTLVRYYYQAAHEFFDDADHELKERLEDIHGCLDKKENSLGEYKKMIEYLAAMQSGLKQKVDDLSFLTDRMNQLFKGL